VRVNLAEELTDGFIYMLNIAALLGIDLERTYERVRATNAKRFGEMAS
jgi:NTP pyrophosphatase (non-canonical NTP hydrolase)